MDPTGPHRQGYGLGIICIDDCPVIDQSHSQESGMQDPSQSEVAQISYDKGLCRNVTSMWASVDSGISMHILLVSSPSAEKIASEHQHVPISSGLARILSRLCGKQVFEMAMC